MEVNSNPCEREAAETKENEGGSISAPLVLSQERTDEVRRRLDSLEEQLKKLQVNGEGGWMRISTREQVV